MERLQLELCCRCVGLLYKPVRRIYKMRGFCGVGALFRKQSAREYDVSGFFFLF